MKRHLVPLVTVVCLGVSGVSLGQQAHPNVATGTRTESLYIDAGSDQVSLFNGNLSYSIPIGEPIAVGPILRIAPRLVYNSQLEKKWLVQCARVPYHDQGNPISAPSGDRIFGAGWQLHFGRLIAVPSGESDQEAGSCADPTGPTSLGTSSTSTGAIGMWNTGFAYQSPDGSVHVFYDRRYEESYPIANTLPRVDWDCADVAQRTPNTHCYGYSHDGSQLRLDPIDYENGGLPVVYFPDGSRQVMGFAGGRYAGQRDPSFSDAVMYTFHSFAYEQVRRKLYTGYEMGPWNTTAILDPWGNSITVAYYGQTVCRVAESCTPPHPLNALPANRQDAIVWGVWDTSLPESRYAQFGVTTDESLGTPVPLVTEITTLSSSGNADAPDRASWTIDYSPSSSELGYFRLAHLKMPLDLTLAASYQEQDLLKSVTLPTGGSLEWDYGQHYYMTKQRQECEGGCAYTFARTTGYGVVARRAKRQIISFGGSATTESAQTLYVRSYDDDPPHCSTGSVAGCEMRVDVWAPAAGTESRTVSRSRFYASDGMSNGSVYGRPMWNQDFRVAYDAAPPLASNLSPFRTTYFHYEHDPVDVAQDYSGFEHNTRTVRTITSWPDGHLLEEHHFPASGATSWDKVTGHFKRTVTQETVPGGSPTILREINETWLPYPNDVPGAWNLGLLSTRKTSRPAGAFDPDPTYLATTESFSYDNVNGFLTTRTIASDNTGDQRTLTRNFTLGTQPSAPCIKGGVTYKECMNRGFPTSETVSLTSTKKGFTPSTYARSFYYKYSTLAAAHDNVSFYAVDRDVAATGKVVGERGPEGRLHLTDSSPQLPTKTTYDLLGRVLKVEPPAPEGADEFAWSTQDVLRQKKDGGGAVVEKSQTFFDQLGRLTAERRALPRPGSPGEFDWSCRVTVLDAAGRRTGQTEWWKNGDPGVGNLCDSPKDVQGPVSTLAPSPATPMGTTWSAFDVLDRPTMTSLADGKTVTDSFEGWWKQETTRKFNSGADSKTTVTRDALGQVVSVTEPAAQNANNQDMNPSEETTYSYDHMGRLIRSVKTGSDASAGNLATQTRTRRYDDFGWLTYQSDPEQSLSVISRDARGNPLFFSDGVSNIYQTYDAAGRILNSRRDGEWPTYTFGGSPATWYEIFTYDAMPGFDFGRSNGRLVWSLRANHLQTNHGTADLGWSGVTSYFHYNGLGGRLGFRQQADLLMPEPALTTPQSVQAMGASKKSPLADAFRLYFEKQGRAAKNDADIKKAVSSPTAAQTLALGNAYAPSGPARWSYTWDTAGRLASLTYPRRDEGNATSVTYAYNWGLPTTITAEFRDPFAAGVIRTVRGDLEYDASGRVSDTKVFTPDRGTSPALEVSSQRDASGLSRPATWQLNLWQPEGFGLHERRAFSYDGSGNITAISSTQADRSASYTYDSRGRLTRDVLGGRPPQDFSYDGFGNLVNVTGPDARVFQTNRSNNRLAERAVYDWAGRMTEDLSRQVQPTDFIVGRDYYPDGGLMVEYAHDPGSNDTKPGPGASIWLLDGRGEGALSFWGDNITTETAKYSSLVRDEGARLLTEYHAELAAGIWQDRYYSDIVRFGPWATATYKRESAGIQIELEARDHLGSPRYVTSTLGISKRAVSLDSFGVRPTGTSVPATRETFTGHERHHVVDEVVPLRLPESDYMHARTYVPMLGRFTRPDPSAKLRLFDPQSLNRYSYTRNNPVNLTDPDGRDWFRIDDKWQYLHGVTEITNVTVTPTGSTTETVKGRQTFVGFNGMTLTLFKADGSKARFPATSGKVDEFGNTQPGLQRKERVGPVPSGQYSFKPSDIQRWSSLSLPNMVASQLSGVLPGTHGAWPGGPPAWGTTRVPLTPSPGTQLFGRGKFFIHGGWFPGSAGCIDLGNAEEDFFAQIPTNVPSVPVDVDYR